MRLLKKDLFLNELYQMAIVYSAPAGLTYLWNFGSMALVSLVIQIFTGIFLAMFYTNSVFFAFDSIEHIMRDVPLGWLIRYIHANGASMFFLSVYLHLCRGLFFCSFYTPRYKLWISGILILFLMMGTAFMGYVLPWGQMSFWAATVITNLASAIPYYGNEIVFWFWGAFSVDVPTLGRFFSLHYLLPFVLVGLVAVHLILLHDSKSSDGLGLNVLSIDRVPFGVYYLIKDIYGFIFYAILFSILVFFYPNLLGHSDNYIEANPMVTPAHIVPEWYFLPFYAILRAIPDKLYGVILMIFSIVFIGLFPFFLHIAKRTNFVPQSGFHRVLFRRIIIRFVICFILLGWLGGQPAAGIYITLGVIFTIFFFFVLTINLYFILLKEMFIYSNHYLLFSKIIQIDFKDYFTHKRQKHDFTAIDDISYLENEYIDLGHCEYESISYIQFLSDPIDYDYDRRYAFLPKLGSKSVSFFQNNEAVYEYSLVKDESQRKIVTYLFDNMHYTTRSEPFSTLHFASSLFTFYLLPTTLDETASEEKKEKDRLTREARVAQGTHLSLYYKDEDLNCKSHRFPKHEMVNPDNSIIMYLLTERDHEYYKTSIDRGIEGFESHDMNHIISCIFSLNHDLNDYEFWHDPIFIFPIIREITPSTPMVFQEYFPIRTIDDPKSWYPTDDFFPLSYTTSTNVTHHNLPLFDANVDRFS